MDESQIWNDEDPIKDRDDLDLDVPGWIDQTISPNEIAAIVQGGCASGAYMPAVTYHIARETMNEHGDDVLQFIEDSLGELPSVPTGESWSGIACFYLSCAVETWANGAHEQLLEWEPFEDEAESA